MKEDRTHLRGFASLSMEKRRRIASMGGKAQGKKTNPGNFANNPERAAKAGRKGGKNKAAAAKKN